MSQQKSLSNLVFELVMACASHGNLIKSVLVMPSMAIIEKAPGAGKLDEDNFRLENVIKIHGRQFTPL